MITDAAVQWVFTLGFAALAAYIVARFVRDRELLRRIEHALHLAMCVAMAAMVWPWWSTLPLTPMLVLFAVAGAWFALLAALVWRGRVPKQTLGGHGAWHQAAHAIMMLAMVWMVWAMSTMPAAPVGSPAGMAHMGHAHGQLGLAAALSGVAATAALIVTGVVNISELATCARGRRTWLGHTGDVAAGTTMTFGMAAMCWPMIAG